MTKLARSRFLGYRPRLVSRTRVVSGLWLMPLLFAACTAADDAHQVAQVRQAVVDSETPASAKAPDWGTGNRAAPPTQPTPNSKKSERWVWAKMKQKPSLAAAVATHDWNARGKQAYELMTQTASSSQASLVSYLAAEKIPYRSFWISNSIKFKADAETIEAVRKRGDVAKIVEDGAYAIQPPSRASLAIVPKSIEWNIESTRAPEVWSTFGTRGEGVVVATIDTGVEYSHEALVNQYRGRLADGSYDHNYNWYDPSSVCGAPSSAPCDNAGHGTHTMGTLVGDDGGENQIGVAPGARWITAKGCEDYSCSLEALVSAGQWMVAPTDLNGQNPRTDLRPNIVSNSWGGGSGDDFYADIIDGWIAAGIFPVFSGGNSGRGCGSLGSPADDADAYAVGAYDSSLLIASFSGRGPSATGSIKPNIAAPGVVVRSSVPGGYETYSGSSMGTPHVAGTVALIWSSVPALIGDVVGTRAILDESAVDHDDTSCGGSAACNNVWGEGQLDAYRAVALGDHSPHGTLVGVVTESGDVPLSGATVALVGPSARRTTTKPDGTYSIRAPVGFYSVTASSFAFYPQTVQNVPIVQDVTTTQDFALERAPSYAVVGVVRDDEGEPVAGATVTLVGTPIAPVLTDPTGAFSFGSVPAGDYQLTVSAGGCLEPFAGPLTVNGEESVPITLDSRVDDYGYTCRLVPQDYIEADTPVALQGEATTVPIDVPFTFMLYGKRYEKALVSTAGYLSFSGAQSGWDNYPIPNPAEPNSALFPFWDDNYMDSRSSAGTKVVGTAPNRKFVMEWRNVAVDFDTSKRITFELVLDESTNQVVFQYAESASTGDSATIGIENATGTVGHQFSYNKPTINAGMAIRYLIPHSGIAQGMVLDRNDGLAVKNAEVVAVDSSGRTLATTTDDQGRYAFQVKSGTYALTVNKKLYGSAAGSAAVVENGTVTQDFSLQTPRAEIAPAKLQLVLPSNAQRTRTLTLSNTGSLPMTFEITEAGGRRQTTGNVAGLAKLPSFDPNASTTQGLYDAATPPRGWSVNDIGDTLFSFTPTGMQLAWGIGYTGNLWLSDMYVLQNSEFTTLGVPTGESWNTPWAGSWPGDMAQDRGRGRLCQLAVGGDNAIHCWDAATGEVTDVITGPWNAISQRGLAYRADDDSFYVGGWNEGIVYHVQGLSGDQPGAVISSCVPSDPNISGLAYNDAIGVLWMATNSVTDTIYQLNPDDCTVLGTLNHPHGGMYNGAGLGMDSEGNLWTIGQSPNTAYLIESGVPAFSEVPWLAVTPGSGNVSQAGTQPLSVAVDTSGMEPGVYLASVFVSTNSGRTPRLRVPVSLVVSAYQQAVNVGGKLYTDPSGDPWATDQAWSQGSWGYMQKGSVVTTHKTIAGTNAQALYQSQRVDPYAYRFDNVPNGIYEVDLLSAELLGAKLGKRLYDVIVENTTVLPAHDIVYDVGQTTADPHQFFVEVTDNRMDIRFIQRAGSKLPVINSLRITQRPDR